MSRGIDSTYEQMRNSEAVFSESVHLVVDTLFFIIIYFMRCIRKEGDSYEEKNGSGAFRSNGGVFINRMWWKHNKDNRV